MSLNALESEYRREPKQHSFSPYDDNGGTTVSIAGDGFVLAATDLRLTQGYSILSRNQGKSFKLTPKTIFSSTGCWTDVIALHKVLKARLTMYKNEHLETMSTTAIAQLVATLLYWRRFFPYYVSTTVSGLDENGKGVIYHYDPVGHLEEQTYSCSGSAIMLIQPLLDNLVGGKNLQGEKPVITKNYATQLIHDAYVSAAERQIETGDGFIIYTITKDGCTEQFYPLRKD